MKRAVVVGDGPAIEAALRSDGWTVGDACGSPVDLLVVVATPPAPPTTAATVTETPDDVFRKTFEHGASRPFRAARDLWPALRAAGGSIVIVTAATAQRGDHEAAASSIAAAAAVAVAELLAAEGADVGIRANALCVADDEGARSAAAGTIVWLARPGAGAISGATIRVDFAASAALTSDTRA